MIKVSVVVPTYRSGDGLDDLVASLDAQTLPASEFEVVFVDDGSPDDTWERLQRIRATRPHVRLERIENSGWPCRPRNVGTDLAQGEFVAYMDHDDLLYPDALRGAYDYAVAHGADVVNGKEARTHDATWAIDTYDGDRPQSLGRADQNPLIPMNPHKLYRRAFLDEHGIRFREGGRVMWEDIFFNLLVQRHASVVSTLSSVPYYHWSHTPGSGSKGFLRSTPEFWDWLREVLVAIDADLAGEAFDLPRAQLRAHQYRSRILGSFDGRFRGRPDDERDLIYAACRALQADFGLAEHDAMLSRSGAIRARLLADDRRELLEALPEHDPVIPGRVAVTALRWTDGALVLDGVARWRAASGRRHAIRDDGGALVKVLPPAYAGAVPAELLDVGAEVDAAAAQFGVRSAVSGVVWMLPGTAAVEVARPPAGVEFEVRVSGTLDPDAVVFGAPLERGLWELNGRCTFAGSTQQTRVRADATGSSILFGDELRTAIVDEDGHLDVAIGDREGMALRLAAPGPVAGVDASSVRIALPGVEVQRAGDAEVSVGVGTAVGPVGRLAERLRRRTVFTTRAARVVAVDGAAMLELPLEGGESVLRVRLGDLGPTGAGWWRLDVRRPTAPRLTPHGRPPRKRAASTRPSLLRRIRRRAGRLVRRIRPRR